MIRESRFRKTTLMALIYIGNREVELFICEIDSPGDALVVRLSGSLMRNFVTSQAVLVLVVIHSSQA